MELTFQSKTVPFLRCSLRQTVTQEQTKEIIVPDSYPDAGAILLTNADAVLRSQESRAGSLIISGAIRASCLYVPEDETQPRLLDSYFPFTLRLDHPAVKEETSYCLDLRVRSADSRLINSRKLLLRVGIGCQITGYEPAQEVFFELKQKPEALQLKVSDYPLMLPAETVQKSFPITEELEIGLAKPAAAQLAGFSVLPVVREQKLNGTKAVLKGDIFVSMLYAAEDGSFQSFAQALPFSQFVELREDYPDGSGLRLSLAVTGADLELQAGSEGRKLLFTGDVLIQCLVSRQQTVTVYEDAYVTEGTLRPEWKDYELEWGLDCQTLLRSVRETAGFSVREVIDAKFYPDFPEKSRTEAGLRITLPVQYNLLVRDEQGAYRGITGRMEDSTELALHPDADADVQAEAVGEGAASAGGAGIDLRLDLALTVCSYAERTLRSLCGGSVEPGEPTQTNTCVIIRRTETQSEIWALAKVYATTVDAIRAANRLTGDEVDAGRMLLIPT